MTSSSAGSGPRDVFSHYELQELIGSGGMAVVYLAKDRRDGVRVALKLIHSHLEQEPGESDLTSECIGQTYIALPSSLPAID